MASTGILGQMLKGLGSVPLSSLCLGELGFQGKCRLSPCLLEVTVQMLAMRKRIHFMAVILGVWEPVLFQLSGVLMICCPITVHMSSLLMETGNRGGFLSTGSCWALLPKDLNLLKSI